MRWALLTCASLSVAAHALAVTLLPPLERPVRIPPHAAGSAYAWQLRVATAPRSANSVIHVAALAQTSDSLDEAPAVDDPTVDAPDAVAETPSVAAPPTETPAAAASEPAPAAGHGVDIEGLTEYIPRPQLSTPPTPQTTVLLAAPEGTNEPAHVSGILSLYIDENGHVHHIVSSGPPMPPEFEAAAKATFKTVTFRPGLLNGQAVKSRIRIEVVFDNTPLTEEAPVTVTEH